ncbi:spermidine family transmembrane transporter [Schizosaccharomyces osmophilus]|uniref:Spermidine family transmembrane transporter n=1 Tax=Schizosaccharomyces osmophilus TaxID=2545709 RepID=A0AAE9W8D9_9SCHI|nr:spermidine family transmembrane transporter [Schizosaccharomyces osmophilus]WBW71169.1 spermidine family transmembrane transporter [Schizosaccharomyces osmophilus]
MSSNDPTSAVHRVQSATEHPEIYPTLSHSSQNYTGAPLDLFPAQAGTESPHEADKTQGQGQGQGNGINNEQPRSASHSSARFPQDGPDLEKQQSAEKVYPTVDNPDDFVFKIDQSSPDFAVNWSTSRKLKITAIYSWAALCSTFASSVFSGPTEVIPTIFHITMTTSLLAISLFICGYCVGPICWGPLSELYGRKPPLAVGMLGFGIFNIAVAVAKDIQTIMICRFFGGFFASAPLTIVAAAFSDMYSNRYRGTAITIFAAIVFDGPLVSPIISGFLTKSYLGWRWTEYITSFMGFFAVVIIILFCDESYAKKIVQAQAQDYRIANNNHFVHAKSEEEVLTPKDVLFNYLLIPIKMLFTEPIVFLVTLYCSFVYGILYLLLEAYPIIFAEKRHFSMGVAQLPYIGLLVGVFIGSAINIAFEPWYFRKVIELGGKPFPEGRLPPLIIGAFTFPAGIFWMAWSGNYPHVHWIVPSLSGLVTGCGILLIFLNCMNYVIDAYLFRAASAVAANTIMRSAVAAGFPLFAIQMFHNLGVGWAGSLLGFIAVALIPVPIAFWFYGRKIRSWSKMAVVL